MKTCKDCQKLSRLLDISEAQKAKLRKEKEGLQETIDKLREYIRKELAR